ncbi:unnamed protein product [Mytilus coruscus]|uniref:Uncharacterized protein n=1 Tax=Mytilus coruscus TaxID=42192 RepID=A0A6J8AHT0_MYTCO|nr:unnamed protein product [Mytilus coruscus]
MLEVLAVKLDQCAKFKKYLLSTKLSELIYNVADTFWGSGWNGSGTNIQGKLLMQLRYSIANTPSVNSPVTTTPIAHSLSVNSPVTTTPIANIPSVNSPVTTTPIVHTLSVNSPITTTPIANTPSVNSPVTTTTIATTPSVNSPVTTTPTANTPPVLIGGGVTVYSVKDHIHQSAIVDILTDPDTSRTSDMPPAKPKGNEVYLIRSDNHDDWKCDQYQWLHYGSKSVTINSVVLEKKFPIEGDIHVDVDSDNTSKRCQLPTPHDMFAI